MKKAKLLPSVLMLVLCVAVLAIGIYAASPVSHSIVGTVSVTAANANVKITAYLDDGDGEKSNDVQASNVYTSRTPSELTLYSNVLEFDCSNVVAVDQVEAKALYFKVENLSSYSLGTYFLEGTVSGETTSDNIAESKSFNGTMGTETISNLITATFTPYTEVPVDGVAYMYSTLKLNQVNPEESTVTINLNLNVEPFNEALLPAENVIKFANASDLNVTVACSVENASTSPSATITKSGSWNVGALAFSDTRYNGQYRLETVKIKMLVTNNHSNPISVSIAEGNANKDQSSSVSVTTIGGSYIAVGATEEVSVQFAAVYDRGTNGSLVEPSIPAINVYNYSVNIAETSEASTVLSRVDYDSTGIANGTMHYFVEFGDNPYVTGEKLRWYIWAKDNGSGAPASLEAGVDYDSTTNTFKSTGSTYYLISQYILDVEDSNMGISYQNEYDSTNCYNPDGNKYACDYAASNLRNYLNGLTVKRAYVYDSNYNYLANGSNVNFLDRFNLTEDALYGQIISRELEDLYTNGANYDGFPSAYAGQADKFWALSYSDWSYMTNAGNSYSNAKAYKLSSTATASYWWLRSPFGISGV